MIAWITLRRLPGHQARSLQTVRESWVAERTEQLAGFGHVTGTGEETRRAAKGDECK